MEEAMDLGFEGKVALITGVGSQIGFGKGIAKYMAKEGCDIVAVDVDLEGAEKTAAEIKALGRKVLTIKTDISNNAEVEDMVEKAIAEFGKIDILVNNAGAGTVLKPFIELTREEWDKPIKTNLYGTLNVTRAVIPHMISRKYGRIVNITGGQGAPTISMYGASKAGVTSFTKSIASELIDYGIVVNGVHPGLGNTGLNIGGRGGRILTDEEVKAASEMFGTKRFCTGEDMGPLVAFLASDVCSYMVGEVLNMGAGSRMRFP
jgi:NAD(P)-dependent dehydrogenase (short-subunit alcohol dehydrogenase family)